MTAAYKLTAELPDGLAVKATWNSKYHEVVTLYLVRAGRIEQKRTFEDQAAADAWAATLGVERWRLHARVRIAPFAAQLPIAFPDAPDDGVLAGALSRLRAGDSFEAVAASLGTDPVTARAWLSGHDPSCPQAMGWKLPNLSSSDVLGGDPYA